MASPLLTFEDVTIYPSDLECLAPRQWLNDQIISFAMARYEKKVFESGQPLRFLDASLVSCLRLQLEDEEEEEVAGFLEGMGLATSSAVVVPLTNKTSFESTSSHWSLLYIDLTLPAAFHYDSCHNSNGSAAEFTLKDIFTLLKRDDMPEVQVVDCYQQENGYDCGICTLLFAEFISYHCENLLRTGGCAVRTIEEDLRCYMTSERVQGYRQHLLQDIRELASSDADADAGT